MESIPLAFTKFWEIRKGNSCYIYLGMCATVYKRRLESNLQVSVSTMSILEIEIRSSGLVASSAEPCCWPSNDHCKEHFPKEYLKSLGWDAHGVIWHFLSVIYYSLGIYARLALRLFLGYLQTFRLTCTLSDFWRVLFIHRGNGITKSCFNISSRH